MISTTPRRHKVRKSYSKKIMKSWQPLYIFVLNLKFIPRKYQHWENIHLRDSLVLLLILSNISVLSWYSILLHRFLYYINCYIDYNVTYYIDSYIIYNAIILYLSYILPNSRDIIDILDEIFLQWNTIFFSSQSSVSPTFWIMPKLHVLCESCRRGSLETL